ncbi:hypothetical protein ID867_09960 [Streptomyces parvulus]|nr:hypothetical protein [Streptomyces parvulus]
MPGTVGGGKSGNTPRRSVFGQLVVRPCPGPRRRLGERVRLPSVPDHRQPYAPQGPGPSPYDQPQAPRIQPVQPQRRTPEPAPAGASNNPLVRRTP